MLWLYLLGAVTALVIALRRVLRRQKPLDDELYSKKVAIEYVHSGVAWVRANGTIGSINPAMAATLGIKASELEGNDWLSMFPDHERAAIGKLHSQMLLLGTAATETQVDRPDGSKASLNLVLVAVHDHKMRFVGHHCLADDQTQQRQLEERVKELTEALARFEAAEFR